MKPSFAANSLFMKGRAMNGNEQLIFPDFPKSWSKLADQPVPPQPVSLFELINSVPVTREELEKARPVSARFVFPADFFTHPSG